MVTWRGHLVAMVTEQDKNREETLEDTLRRTTRLGLTWPPNSSDLSPASVGCAEQRSDQRRHHLHLASRAAPTGPESGPSKNEIVELFPPPDNLRNLGNYICGMCDCHGFDLNKFDLKHDGWMDRYGNQIHITDTVIVVIASISLETQPVFYFSGHLVFIISSSCV